MERGTDREFEVLRERALTDRPTFGAALVGVGALPLVLSLPEEACVHGGVGGSARTSVEGSPDIEATRSSEGSTGRRVGALPGRRRRADGWAVALGGR